MSAAKHEAAVHDRRSSGAERLLSAASRLFAAKGYDGTAVREILAAAHVGPTVLYYHFGSKEGLHAATLQREADQYAANLERAAAGSDSAVARIRRVCLVHADWKPRVDPARLVEVLGSLVREGIERGELAGCDPDAAAAALAGVAETAGGAEHSALSFVLEKLR